MFNVLPSVVVGTVAVVLAAVDVKTDSSKNKERKHKLTGGNFDRNRRAGIRNGVENDFIAKQLLYSLDITKYPSYPWCCWE